MSSQVTQWGAHQWVGMAFGIVDVPAHYWIALASKEPGTGIDGTMLEQLEPPVTAGSSSYARVELAASDVDFVLSDAGYVANLVAVDFGTPDVNWGFTPYFALCDAATAGHVYAYGQFTNPAQLGTAFSVSMPIGSIVLQALSAVPSIVT